MLFQHPVQIFVRKLKSFDITVTDEILEFRKRQSQSVRDWIQRYRVIDYATYVKFRKKIRMEGE